MKQLFELGAVVATAGVAAWMEEEGLDVEVANRLCRHVSGEWGEVCEEDAATNEEALQYGNRIMSVYTVRGVKIWIITEADRSSTTVLFPDEY